VDYYRAIYWATVSKTIRSNDVGPLSVCPVLSVCLSLTLVYCGQTVTWMEMKLGTEVGLGPGHIVLDWDTTTHFSARVYCGQTAEWIKMPLGGRPRPRRLCVR